MSELTINEASIQQYTNKVTFNHTDVTTASASDAGTDTVTATAVTFKIPVSAGEIIQDATVKIVTAFDGDANVNIAVGHDNSSNIGSFIVSSSDNLGSAGYIRNTGAKLSVDESGSTTNATIGHLYSADGFVFVRVTAGTAISGINAGEFKLSLNKLNAN